MRTAIGFWAPGALDFDEPIEMPGLKEALTKTGKNIAKKIEWKGEEDYHKEE